MKKIITKTPLIGKISFVIPEFNSLSKILLFVQQTYLYGVFFLLPFFSLLFTDQSYETAIFYSILFASIPLISIFVIRVILFGSPVFVDPKGFIIVLFFALLTTAASISVDSPSTTNTFGEDSLRGLSGVFVMGMIALYYGVNATVRDKNAFKRYFFALIVGFISYSYMMVMIEASFTHGIIVLSSIPFLLGLGFAYRKLLYFIYIYIAVLLIGILFIADIFVLTDGYFIPFEVIIFVSTIMFIVTSYLLVSNSGQKFKSNDSWITRLVPLNKQKQIVISWNTILNFIPVAFLTTIVAYFFYELFNSDTFNDYVINGYDSFIDGFNSLTSSRFDTIEVIQNLFLGLGADANIVSQTLYTNVLVSQGFFGIIAYVILFGSALYFGSQFVVKSYLNHSYFPFISTLFFVIGFIPLLSFFTYPGIYLLIVWWISFSMLMAYNSFAQSKESFIYTEKKLVLTPSFISNKNGNIALKVFFVLIVIILTSFIIYQLADSIGEV